LKRHQLKRNQLLQRKPPLPPLKPKRKLQRRKKPRPRNQLLRQLPQSRKPPPQQAKKLPLQPSQK
jgi:hypothetical protein